ncbi:hypothetical protein OR1_00879 [Geobacter sp. OR-1]|uniref:hypothetical protein n=1 Tax=Geobacter sp. OR-1 TaxID=1266765 RepID=UPI000541A42F|nr:hypothetical protein [Geobacter sp. OR-1]GAM08607.1 hypothetical protein OR1_00879 [Geobacter sp. OR-1]
MRELRYGVIVLWMLLICVPSASAEISIGIGLPNLRIGINLPVFPELVPVPGYPVYYAPQVDSNYFFYDGMYWVYQDDSWYSSYWYDGPWYLMERTAVPLFILRVPVRYYRHPPAYFRSWRPDAPPRWGQHWGREWEQRHRGWDKWKRGSAPARAPLPVYQRQYSGDRYPHPEQQQTIRREHYRYQPRDKAVRQHFQQQGERKAPEPGRREKREEPRVRAPEHQDIQRPAPHQPPQQREPAYREQREQRQPRQQPGAVQQERQAPRPHGQEQRLEDKGRSHEPRGQGQEQGQRREEDRGRDRHN